MPYEVCKIGGMHVRLLSPTQGDGSVKGYRQAIINIVLGTIALAVISLVCVTHAIRIIYNLRQKKVW